MMNNTVAISRNLRPNGLKTGRVLQFLVGLVVCIWLVYQITQPQHGSVDEGVNSLGRKQTAGQLNVRGKNLDTNNGEGEMVEEGESSITEGDNIQVDLQGGKRGEIAFSDETNKYDQGSSSNQQEGNLQGGKRVEEIAYSDETSKNNQGSSTGKVSENLLGTVTSYRESDVSQDKDEAAIDQERSENLLGTVTSYQESDVSQDKDEAAIDQEGEENSATQNTTIRSQYNVFGDENGIPKEEMRDGKFAGSSSLNDQSESP